MISSFYLAWKELASNKSRSILTALGIVIGVFAVTLIVASGELVNQYIRSLLLDQVGDTRLISLDKLSTIVGNSVEMTVEDFEFLQEQAEILPYSNPAALSVLNSEFTNFEGEDINLNVFGITPNFTQLFFNNFQNFEGRVFTESENNVRSRVAFVTRAFAENVLGKTTVLGETIEIDGQEFQVIAEYDVAVDLFTGQEQVYIPVETLWEIDGESQKNLQEMYIIADSEALLDFVADEIKFTINSYRENQFTGGRAEPLEVRVARDALDLISDVLIGLQVFLALIAVIALIVGGIGITNVMLMSVTQRIREIGIRKALGANNRDILSIFLSESVLLTTLSGLVGAGLAQYFIFIILEVLVFFDVFLDFVYSWNSIYIATLTSLFIGIGFGLFPAWQASRLEIVDALRYD